jgi:Putative F0F1-ATPase subunit Ca2+/Mg2+ transporter
MAEDRPSPATTSGEPSERTGAAPGGRQPTLGDLFWIGTACAIAVIAGGGIGYAIDDAAGTLPWFTVGGLAFGVLSAVLLAVNQFRKYV